MKHAEILRQMADSQLHTASCWEEEIAFHGQELQKRYEKTAAQYRERAAALLAGAEALEEKERRDAQIG
jgi:hypothetical protein